MIGSCLLAGAAQRVDRRFELQEVLIRGRLAFVGIDELTGGLDEPGTSSGLLLAILGLPWVLRERRPVSRELEAALRTLAD